MNIDKITEEWTKENKPLGQALGYPDCCITAFCNQPPEAFQNKKLSPEDIDRFNASFLNGEFTGFIPCAQHARQILDGKITLASLIDNNKRIAGLPAFPEAFKISKKTM